MLRYALTRLLSLGLGLAVASLVVFVLLEVVPGDPAAYMLGLNATPEAVAALRTDCASMPARSSATSPGSAAC